MDEEQADAIEQAFDLDYDVAQVFCSQIVPKVVLFFTGGAPNDSIYFEPEDGEGYDDNNNKGGGGTGFPFPASAKTTGE